MVKCEYVQFSDIDDVKMEKADECSVSPDGYCHYPAMCRFILDKKNKRQLWGITLWYWEYEGIIRHVIMPEDYDPESEVPDECIFCGEKLNE